MIYEVAITETRRRIVTVDADTPEQAHRRVSDAWRNGEVLLDDDTFEGIEVYVNGPAETTKGYLEVERKDF